MPDNSLTWAYTPGEILGEACARMAEQEYRAADAKLENIESPLFSGRWFIQAWQQEAAEYSGRGDIYCRWAYALIADIDLLYVAVAGLKIGLADRWGYGNPAGQYPVRFLPAYPLTPAGDLANEAAPESTELPPI